MATTAVTVTTMAATITKSITTTITADKAAGCQVLCDVGLVDSRPSWQAEIAVSSVRSEIFVEYGSFKFKAPSGRHILVFPRMPLRRELE